MASRRNNDDGMAAARAQLDEQLAALRRAESSGTASHAATKGVVTTKSGVPGPSHLLWDEASAIQRTTRKKSSKKKHARGSGWGLTFAAEEGSSPESRGVTTISLTQLPGYVPPQQPQPQPQPQPPQPPQQQRVAPLQLLPPPEPEQQPAALSAPAPSQPQEGIAQESGGPEHYGPGRQEEYVEMEVVDEEGDEDDEEEEIGPRTIVAPGRRNRRILADDDDDDDDDM